MNFQIFWNQLDAGGETEQGDCYHVTDNGRLHLISQGNQNQHYRITRSTVERYFNLLQNGMDQQEFRYRHSAYFCNVYNKIVNEL